MKRFFTVNEQNVEAVLNLIRNAAVTAATGAATNDVYNWLKKQLQQNQITHHDQNANHHDELPHQGGYVSFYVDVDGEWYRVNH